MPGEANGPTAFDPGLADRARTFYRATSFDERRRLAEAIVRLCVGATGFFEWELEPS